MIRVWCEQLPLEELVRPQTLDLLVAEGAHPIVAMRPTTDPASLAAAIAASRQRGLQIGVWSLLDQDAGYWPSERNVETWTAATLSWLDELEAREARPDWLAVDLEPPFDQSSRVLRRALDVPLTAARFGRENLNKERFDVAEAAFGAFAHEVRRRGVRTLGITLPMAAHDLRDGEPIWQDLLETPWADVPWDAAGIMAYGSMVAGLSGGLLSTADARAIHQRLLVRLHDNFGDAAHVSLGVTGVGVFGDEPTWETPAELALDASAALAAGMRDIGLFCLEGILDRETPEAWLQAVTRAEPIPPVETWKSSALGHAARAARGWTRRYRT